MLDIPDESIPEGKLISTTHGGQKTLDLSMEKLKKFEFTGYIRTRKKHEGYVSEGYIILKDGNLIAAVYGRRVDGRFIVTKKGEEGLKLAWGDSYDVESDMEVHGRLDINAILQRFPMSEIKVATERKVLKRRTRFSLEWGNNGQESTDKSAESLPKELNDKLEEWRSHGYVVKFLLEEVAKDPKNAKMAFEQFESNVNRAEFLRKELDSLDCKMFTADMERLRAMLKNPSKITSIEAALQGLKLKIDQEKSREREEKLAELMAQSEFGPAAPLPEPKIEIQEKPAKTAEAPAAIQPSTTPGGDELEESLAGHGDIIPPEKEPGNKCTVCGSELYGKEECSTCGADNSAASAEPQPLGDSNLIPEYTFENFVVGESNRFSHSAATAVSKPGTSSYNPLFICSGTGLGKTHLLNAIGNFVVSNYPDKRVLYITTEKFINEFIEATKTNQKKQFRKKYRDLDVLLLDDIHFIAGQEAVQDEFFHTFNSLYKDGKQIVMTSDRPIREVTGIKERLVSRFDAGLITDMQAPDVETRQAILRLRAEAKKIVVGDDVLHFIATKYVKNIRLLEGALKTLLAYSELMKAPITLETAKLALKDEPTEVQEEDADPKAAIGAQFNQNIERLKLSHSYLIEEDRPVNSFRYFVDNLNLGLRGFALTRVNPKRLAEEHDLGEATVLWLTDKEGDSENRVMPVLEKIIYRIEDFLNTPGRSILLIDGLDYLISSNSFDSVLRFLRRLIDEVSESDAILITSISPETIDEQGLKILEREMEIISFLSISKTN